MNDKIKKAQDILNSIGKDEKNSEQIISQLLEILKPLNSCFQEQISIKKYYFQIQM